MIAPCGPFYTIPVLIPFPSFSFLKTLIRNSTRHSLLHNSVENQDKTQQVFLHCCRNSPTIAWQLSQGSYYVMDLSLGSHHYSSSPAQHCHQLWGLAFRAPPGPWVLPGDSNSTGPGSGELCCHPQRERVAGRARTPAQKVPVISLSSPYCGSFFSHIIPRNSYFCKNSGVIPIRW